MHLLLDNGAELNRGDDHIRTTLPDTLLYHYYQFVQLLLHDDDCFEIFSDREELDSLIPDASNTGHELIAQMLLDGSAEFTIEISHHIKDFKVSRELDLSIHGYKESLALYGIAPPRARTHVVHTLQPQYNLNYLNNHFIKINKI